MRAWVLSVVLPVVLRAGDHATETTVLMGLYAKHALRRESFGLEALLVRLGVHRGALGVTLDEAAELAWIRRAIADRT